MRFDGQQRVMRLSGVLLRSPAEKQVLTNRMREIFTYGSVGGAEGNLGSYPAANPAWRRGLQLVRPVCRVARSQKE